VATLITKAHFNVSFTLIHWHDDRITTIQVRELIDKINASRAKTIFINIPDVVTDAVVGGAAVVTNGLVVCVTPVVVPARTFIFM